MLSIYSVFYNRASHVNMTVSSLKKSVPKGSKVILIDDLSTDNTYELLLDVVSDDDRFIVAQNNVNMGFTSTLNYIIEDIEKKLGSKYIAIHGAGDGCGLDKFNLQLEFLESNPDYVFCATRHKVKNSKGDLLGESTKFGEVSQMNLIKTPPYWTHGTVVYRSESYFNVGGYNPTIKLCQDWELYLRILNVGRGYVLDNSDYFKVVFSDGATFKPEKRILQLMYSKLIMAHKVSELESSTIEGVSNINSFYYKKEILRSMVALAKKGELKLLLEWCSVIDTLKISYGSTLIFLAKSLAKVYR